jgi:VanZ family protein
MPKQSLIRVISRYAPLLIWLTFISIASSDGFSAGNTSRIIEPIVLWFFPHVSHERLETIHFLTRKLAHFSEYALLAILAARAFSTSPGQRLRQRWFIVSLGLIVLYALLDEYHQSYVPSRTASIYDSFIDMTGGLAALAAFWWRKRRTPTNSPRGDEVSTERGSVGSL